MAIQDYTNRKYDYLALQNTALRGERLLGLELFNEETSGKLCVGVQKLAQRWLLEFFTEVGSMPGAPTRGSSFLPAARSGGLRSQINVRGAFADAVTEIQRNLQAEEYPDMPDDERYGNTELLNFTISPETIKSAKTATSIVFLRLTVKITSLAGDSREIIVPVETVPRG